MPDVNIVGPDVSVSGNEVTLKFQLKGSQEGLHMCYHLFKGGGPAVVYDDKVVEGDTWSVTPYTTTIEGPTKFRLLAGLHNGGCDVKDRWEEIILPEKEILLYLVGATAVGVALGVAVGKIS